MKKTCVVGLLLCILPLIAASVFAGGPAPGNPNRANCGDGGTIFESASRNARFQVYATNASQNVIDADPGTAGNQPFTTVTGNNLTIIVPGTLNGQLVCDVKNITNLLSASLSSGSSQNPGASSLVVVNGGFSELDIEALVLDVPNNVVVHECPWCRVEQVLGANAILRIPDLYADINLDGNIDDADVLYSAIDVNQYMQAVPTFTFGDLFSITNGESATLPGMVFSTSPITFNSTPGSGIGGSSFSGTPYTGDASALSDHSIAQIPEPTTLLLLTVAIVMVDLPRRRRSRVLLMPNAR